ncbi:MAG: thioredoxin [Nitrospirae bacterium]|nr:MAG: thioredoxin [Nitrospirota bacterium]
MLKRTFTGLFTIAALIGLVLGQARAGSISAPQSTPELRKALSAGKKTVVFFQNPQGGPCRAQNEILQKLLKDRAGKFQVAYVNAMNPQDQKAFYDYGIRNLPSLVLVDGTGKIGRVFPPGIQSYEVLAQALDSIK